MTDRRRRHKEQRAAKLKAEKKKKARRELARRLVIALGFGILVIGFFAAGSLFGKDGTSLPPTYEKYRNQPTACGADQPEPEKPMTFSEPTQQDDLASVTNAVITTSCGDIVIELDPANYPDTVNSFVFLARQGFYNGQVFHRIIANFVAQAGDPSADGSGGPGYRIADEYPAADFTYVEGTVAMGNGGKGTTGSQFFFTLGGSGSVLNPQYNILGNVVSGQDTLKKMAEVAVSTRPGSSERSVPQETVYIETITIETAG